MNIDRLTTLANFLDTVPVNKFDLAEWREVPEVLDPHWTYLTDHELTRLECNTTGCAVGWACVIPEFNAEGFKWRVGVDNAEVADLTGTNCPVWKNKVSWFAVEAFFELTECDSFQLFNIDSYYESEQTPSAVANRIRDLITTAKR